MISVPRRHDSKDKSEASTDTRAPDVARRGRGSHQGHRRACGVRERRQRAANIELLLRVRIRSAPSPRVADDDLDDSR